MKFSYDPETDSLYIDLSDPPSMDSREVAEDLVLDFGEDGQVVGIDIQHASRFVDLSEVNFRTLPTGLLQRQGA